MRRRNGWTVGGWALRLALVLVVATGCHSCSLLNPFWGIFEGHLNKTQGGTQYLAIRATKGGGGATVRPNRELWKPFRLEVTLGLFDPDHADLGADGSFGVSVLQAGGLGAFYIMEVKRSGDGIVVSAGSGSGQTSTLTIPDSLIADIEFKTSGGLLIMSARKHGDAEFTALRSGGAASAGPYQASMDIGGIPKGTVVGYGLARLTENGAPAAPTAEQTARETVYTAIDAFAEAMYAINRETPDRTASGDQIELGIARIDAARALDLSALPGAAKKLAAARKKAAKLVGGARGTKPPATIVKGLVAVLKLSGAAADPE